MPKQPLIVGNPVFVVVDMQEGGAMSADDAGIPVMPGHAERVERAERLLAAARGAGIPVVFFQEVHRPSGIDFGRELDGTETVHCLEGDVATELAAGLEPRPDEYLIRKRRYSAFFATELDLVLRSYGTRTLILVGALTDVCVHYTFADAHQHDYHCRVITDCVGGSSRPAHDAALAAMAYLQRDCLVTSDEMLEAFRAAALPVRGVG